VALELHILERGCDNCISTFSAKEVKKLSKVVKAILELNENGVEMFSSNMVQQYCDLSTRTIGQCLKTLRKLGYLKVLKINHRCVYLLENVERLKLYGLTLNKRSLNNIPRR